MQVGCECNSQEGILSCEVTPGVVYCAPQSRGNTARAIYHRSTLVVDRLIICLPLNIVYVVREGQVQVSRGCA